MPDFAAARITLIQKWKNECVEYAQLHSKKAMHLKRKYQIFGMLQLLLPIGFTLANQILGTSGPVTILASIGFATTGIVSVVLNFLNFKVLSAKHELSANAYHALENDISSIMTDHISPPDVLMTKVKTELKNLETYSPDINTGICCCPN